MHTPSLSLFASQVAALRATKAQPAKSRAVVVTRAAKDPRGVYIGKGKWIQDDDAKYASRDDWFTGGWPGGEVGLKEGFIQEPFEKPSGGQAEEYDLPEDYKGEDTVYIGKGKYVKGDAKKFAGRDNLFTGGWAGGEVSLKNAEQLKLKVGDYVQIKAEERRDLRLFRNHHRRASEDGHREEGRGWQERRGQGDRLRPPLRQRGCVQRR
jgi:hypothetical protein